VFVGGNSRYVEDAYAINANLKRGLCSVIKVIKKLNLSLNLPVNIKHSNPHIN
jgi:hypothetical protein